MQPKILYINICPISFIEIDRDLLAKRYVVSEIYPKKNINIEWFSIFRAMQQHDLVIGWFASWHTFISLLMAKSLGKPSLLIIGGYDIANMPAIGYGHQRGGLKKWVSRWTIRLATTLMTNSYYSQREAIANIGLAEGEVNVVHHGIPDPFNGLSDQPREDLVLSVGNVKSSNLLRKGHQSFVEAAAFFPDKEFRLVGAWKDDAIKHLHRLATPNVNFTDRVSDKELLEAYQQAYVYVQASAHEGFGMSVAESMLAGSIPVVTKNGSLPEVVGDCGIYTESQSPAHLADAIQKAFLAPESLRARARERILTHFPLRKRAEGLYDLVERMIKE